MDLDRLFALLPFVVGGTHGKPFVKGMGEAVVIAALSAGSMYVALQSKFDRIESLERKVDTRQEKIDKIDSIERTLNDIKTDLREIRSVIFKPRFKESYAPFFNSVVPEIRHVRPAFEDDFFDRC